MADSGPAAAMVARFLDEHPFVEQVELLIPDLAGIPRGKRVTIEALRDLERSPLAFSSTVYALDTTGENVARADLVWGEGDADRPLALDLATLAPVPWKPQRAQVLGGLLDHDGTPFYADPRAALRTLAARLEARGLRAYTAFELEFYLLDRDNDAEGRPLLPVSARLGRRPRSVEVYSHDRIEEQEEFFDLVLRYAEAQGLTVTAIDAEFAPGQFEVNLAHLPDPVHAADAALLLKRTIRAAARECGGRATFMAKPFAAHSGNGTHVHLSLCDADGRNLFGETADGEQMLRHVIGGLAATMAEAMAIFAPNANSYRRLQPMSYAPLAPSWGFNNRTVALRVPAGPPAARRVEHRVAGADANPYLVLAAILAGVLHGLDEKADPGPPVTGNAYAQIPPSLPRSWESALAHLRAAPRLRRQFDARLLDLYALARETERERFERQVSPLEYEWYLASV